jgi:hypothetical protein
MSRWAALRLLSEGRLGRIMKKAAADQYRRHAEDAERAAQASADYEVKEFYREIARRWRETAGDADPQRWWTAERGKGALAGFR